MRTAIPLLAFLMVVGVFYCLAVVFTAAFEVVRLSATEHVVVRSVADGRDPSTCYSIQSTSINSIILAH